MTRFRVDDGAPFDGSEGDGTTSTMQRWFARAKGYALPSSDGPPVALADPDHQEGSPVHPDPVSPVWEQRIKATSEHYAQQRPAGSWIGPAVTLVLLVASSLLVALLLTGCSSVSQAEYRALVEAATSYRDAVAPMYRASVENDQQLSERSKKSRLALDDDFQASRPSWEKRAGIVAKPPECPDDEMLTGPPVCIGPCRFFWFGPHVHEGAVVRVLR